MGFIVGTIIGISLGVFVMGLLWFRFNPFPFYSEDCCDHCGHVGVFRLNSVYLCPDCLTKAVHCFLSEV